MTTLYQINEIIRPSENMFLFKGKYAVAFQKDKFS